MRGKRAIIAQCILYSGITPADAGKTNSAKSCRRSLQDHPRGCGENSTPNLPGTATSGSPPQVRGKHTGKGGKTMNFRITPAGAGKTKNTTASNAMTKDHPRRCGENFSVVDAVAVAVGSPPQVRGKRNESILEFGRMQDHPRRCGENYFYPVP